MDCDRQSTTILCEVLTLADCDTRRQWTRSISCPAEAAAGSGSNGVAVIVRATAEVVVRTTEKVHGVDGADHIATVAVTRVT